MTRKDYVLIANRIKFNLWAVGQLHHTPEQIAPKREALCQLAESLAHDLHEQNPAFDRDRFLRACGVA